MKQTLRFRSFFVPVLLLAFTPGCATQPPTRQFMDFPEAPLEQRPISIQLSDDSATVVLAPYTERQPTKRGFLGLGTGRRKQKNVGNTSVSINITKKDKSEHESASTDKSKVKTEVDASVENAITEHSKLVDRSQDKSKTKLDETLKVKSDQEHTENAGFLATPGSQVGVMLGVAAIGAVFIFFFARRKKDGNRADQPA